MYILQYNKLMDRTEVVFKFRIYFKGATSFFIKLHIFFLKMSWHLKEGQTFFLL